MRSYASVQAFSLVNVVFAVIVWATCGIAAAGLWNAAKYEYFHNCGRQGFEDRSNFLVSGILGGPMALILALLETSFGRSGWSLSPHECAEPVRPDFFGMPS